MFQFYLILKAVSGETMTQIHHVVAVGGFRFAKHVLKVRSCYIFFAYTNIVHLAFLSRMCNEKLDNSNHD